MSRNRFAQRPPLRATRLSRPPAGVQSDDRSRTSYIVLALCALTLIVFLQAVHFEFINFDDTVYVQQNSSVQKGLTAEGLHYAFTTYSPNWHPLTWLSHSLDCQFFGLNAGWHHLTNVILHMANIILLFFLLLRLTGAFWRSALVAALFAIHPLHVESVAWIAERKDLLGCLFWLLTMWMYVGYVRGPDARRKYLLSLLMFLLAIMSKPSVVTLPFTLLLLDYWPLQRLSFSSIGALLKEKIPFFLLSGFLSVITYVGQKQSKAMAEFGSIALGRRVANVLTSYALYLRDLIWPESLAVFYPYPLSIPGSTLFLSIALLAAVTALVLWRARKSPYLPAGWLWYLGVLIPMIGVVQVGSQSRADRYTYIPSIGIFVIIVWAASEAAARYLIPRKVLISTCAVIVAALAARCWVQTSYWKNSETLFTHSIAITGRSSLLKKAMGEELLSKHRPREAEQYFRAALADEPNFVEWYQSLGKALIEQNKDAARVHEYLGMLLLNVGHNEAALKEEETALTIKPGSPSARMNRALVWGALGRMQESLTELANLRAENPNDERIRQAWQYVQNLSQPSANKQVRFPEPAR